MSHIDGGLNTICNSEISIEMVSGMRTLLSAVLWAAMAPLGVAPKAPSRRVTRATTANATKKSLKKAAAAPPTPSPSPRAEKVGGNRGGRKSKNKKKAKDRLPPLTDLFENQAQYPTFMKQIRNEAPTYDGINGAKISEGLDSGDRREFLQSVGQLACYASSTTLGNLGEALLIDHLKHAAALPPAAARAQPPKDLSLVHIHRRKYPAEDGYSVKWMNENGEAGLDHDAEVWQEAEDDEEKVLDVESKFSQIGYAVKNPYVVKTGERKGEKTPGYTRSSYKPLFSENEIARIEVRKNLDE